jgi:hypothetical protein
VESKFGTGWVMIAMMMGYCDYDDDDDDFVGLKI